MSRKITVAQYRGASLKPVVSVTYRDAREALASFTTALAGAGHDDRHVAGGVESLALVLLSGGRGVSIPDPDLNGHIEINVIP